MKTRVKTPPEKIRLFQINGNTSHRCQVNKIFIFWFLCSLSAAVINKFLIMEDSALKCIDERLDRLENLVYGPSSANTDNKVSIL